MMPADKSRMQAGVSDFRTMRASTAVGLWVVVVIAGFLSLVLGTNEPSEPRTIALIAVSVVSTVLGLLVVPLLLRASVTAAARHPLLIALIACAGVTWVLALVPPFAGWAWAFPLVIAGGILSCVVPGWWRAAVPIITLALIFITGALVSHPTGSGSLASSPLATAGLASPADLIVIGTLVLLVFTPLSTVWALQVVLRLDEARQTASDLAVATERLRFATDLHDIQGHHLQVIALKSELAERLLVNQPERSAREIADIREIAKAALEDTRAVVNDYRTVTVAVEVRNAAAVLRSAGIDCEARISAPELSTSVGAVFAIAIREAATNVLRHSRATEAGIALSVVGGEYRLTVSNNGAGALRSGGTGLRGLRERLTPFLGTVQTARVDDVFTLTVRIPVTADSAPVDAR
ncbi:sensor histidine kinase [Agreia pratensis]|uniref:Two-component system, NarL family, sensor histidine kinase DesK n=1 Tax=Agreia pratensis TaxID=150121 RepID=A0A1X7KW67_9MICO|nr:histidine kinase [Agreia pratensis]SMG45479.1 two-component system, NarL family, sensor histidine kinase DesK [Agreia pratensis]